MKLRLLSLLLLSGFATSFFTACEIINPEEETPSYIKIDKIDINYPSADITSANITDAWVFVRSANGADYRLIGAFELPATIPILQSGPTTMNILPGIISDGVKSLRTSYPFYTSYETTLNLQEGKVLEVQPAVTYKTSLLEPFPIIENFSAAPVTIDTETGSIYKVEISDDPALQFPASQGKVGVVYAKQDTLAPITLYSDFSGKLPQNGNTVYLEMDYKTNMYFKVGVIATVNGQESQNYQLTVRPNENFTKLYVNLVEEISQVNDPSATFRVFIEAQPTGKPGEYLALDNVRLLRYNN